MMTSLLLCNTYHGVLEGSLLLLLCGLLPQPGKESSGPSVQDEGILCVNRMTQVKLCLKESMVLLLLDARVS